ncbi:MAG: hypothetical protein ACRERE_21225 [Candidatus Entotheonellia bacterium]
MTFSEKLASWLAGKASGCPFCLVRGRELPRVGERVRVLYDEITAGIPSTGKVGTVIKKHVSYPLKAREVQIQLDGNSSGGFTTIDIDQVLVENLPGSHFPSWIPPIRLSELGGLEDMVIRLFDDDIGSESRNFKINTFYYLISYVWSKKIPLKGEELWTMLEVHGMPLNWKDELIKRYEYGIETLVRITGERLYKNRRMVPLSEKDMWLRSLCKRRKEM